MKRVTKKESSQARKFANDIIELFHKEFKNKYTFTQRIVGSAVYNTILKDKEGFYDVDYQLLLTKNSKEYKTNGLKNTTIIKNDFFNCINDVLKNNKKYKVENSTTAITVINLKEKYSIDFVIIRMFPKNDEIIRRNNKKNSSINEYTWNKLHKYNDAYKKFYLLSATEKNNLIENYILPRKVKEKSKNDNDPTKRSSSELFIEEVNNYVVEKWNNRL